MRRAVLAGLLASLSAACAGNVAEQPSPARVAHEATVRPDCYTVDLFKPEELVTPVEAVPAAWTGYVGRWGDAAWDGEWCHDLYVLEVRPDGRVSVIETHAPYPEWGKPVTAYRRTAKIGEDGRLRLDYGSTRVEYWLEDGKLYGLRREGGVRRRIALSREASA